jgi:alpha,alpha-trehalase
MSPRAAPALPSLLLLAAALLRPAAAAADDRLFPVDDNLARLLRECDRDGDRRITVDDRPPCAFALVDDAGAEHPVSGVYPLSVLLQELSLARDRGQARVALSSAALSENPVDRTHRMIRDLYWDGLTRVVDERGLARALDDPKAASADGLRRLYVPADDPAAYAYFADVARRRPELRLRVERLPARPDGNYVRGLDGRHGLLSLALAPGPDGALAGRPFVVPGGRFNELYGWDSHFIALGLLEDGRVELARSMVDDQVYEIRHYGRVLNANRTYFLTRSQPPLLTSTLRAIAERLPDTAENRAWVQGALEAALAEYRGTWTAPPRLVAPWGLSRYFDDGAGPCPEVEPGHYDPILRPYANRAGLTPARYLEEYLAGRAREPALDAFFHNDRAVRESGHDTTNRFDERADDFLTVDLNSLLYKTETDAAFLLDRWFGGRLKTADGGIEKAADWRQRAEARKKTMNALFWDEKEGFFFDYDVRGRRRSGYVSATAFYPLWAGWADARQAVAVRDRAVRDLEQLGGLSSTSEAARGAVTDARPQRQWDYPYGWAPHQILAWQGLRRYGLDADARRLAYRWLWTIVKNARDYDGTVPEKYDVVKASHRVFAEYGNVGTEFAYITKEGFGWMNASFELGLNVLSPELLAALRAQTPPERLFAPPPAKR